MLRAWSDESLAHGHARLSPEFARLLKAALHTKVKVEKVTYSETKFSSISLRAVDWGSEYGSPKVEVITLAVTLTL